MNRVTGMQLEELRGEVGRVLRGTISLDEFVRWVARSRHQGGEVSVALMQVADGSMGVDELYCFLAKWHRTSKPANNPSVRVTREMVMA